MENVQTGWAIRKFLVLVGAAALGLITASHALGSPHDWRTQVRDHADNVNYLAREVRRELIHVSSHSCLFGQMMAEVGRLESNAAILRAWARHQAPLQLESKVHELAGNSDRLQALIEEAWLRGQRGVHRPLLCTQRLRGQMAQVDQEIYAAYRSIPGTRTVYSAPRVCGHWGGVPQTFPSQWSNQGVHFHQGYQSSGVQLQVQLGNGIQFRTQTQPDFQSGRNHRQSISGSQFSLGTDRHSVGRRYPDLTGTRR